MSTELLNISNVGAAAILKTPSYVIHDVTWLVTVSEGWLCGHCGKSPSHSHIPPERGEGLGVGMEWQPCCLVSLLIDMHQMLACLPRHFQSSLTLNNQTFLTFGCLQTENVACSRDHDELLKCPLGRMPTIFPKCCCHWAFYSSTGSQSSLCVSPHTAPRAMCQHSTGRSSK